MDGNVLEPRKRTAFDLGVIKIIIQVLNNREEVTSKTSDAWLLIP